MIRPAATGSGADDVTTPMLHSRGMSDAPSVDAPPLLEMRGMTKRFPGVDALRDVDLRLEAGECLALCGENGAGKSTLVKLLGGVHRADAGEIRIDGRPTGVPSPHHARRLGIALIHQELSLVPRLSARENIFLGRERTRFGFPDHRREARDATRLFERLGVDVDPESSCGDLTVAQQQAVEIARALAVEARVIVMDEPSATLTAPETRRLFGIIQELTASGLGVIYISHRIEEIFDVAARVQVLRDGRLVTTAPTAETANGAWAKTVSRAPLVYPVDFDPPTLDISLPDNVVTGLVLDLLAWYRSRQ